MRVSGDVIIRNKSLLGYSLVFLMLFSRLSFFRPIFVSDDLLKIFQYGILGVIILLFFQHFKTFETSETKRHFQTLILALILNVIITLFIAEIQWGQSWLSTLISSIPIFSVMLYFYAHAIDITRGEVEKIFYWLTVIYTICFFLALAIYPAKIFTGYGELEREIDTSRGFPRIRLTLMGLAPIFFYFFCLLSKLKERFDKRTMFLFIFVSILILLQLGRVPIILSVGLGLWYYTSHVSNVRKFMIAVAFGLCLWIVYANVTLVQELVDYSINDYENSTENENVRISSFRFYTIEFPNTWSSIIFGNGQYSLGKSSLGDYVDNFGRSNGFIPADVGYAYIFLNYGFAGIILLLAIVFKVLTLQVDRRYEYVKYYIVFLFLVNFSGNTVLGGLPFVILSLYLLDQGHFLYRFKQKKYEEFIRENKR